MNDEQLKATLKEMNDTAEKILDAVSIVGHLSKSMRDGESLVGWVKRMIAERDAAQSYIPPHVDKPVVPDLILAIRECEQERLNAQMSGLDTGWEHPATQSMWRRVQALAEIVISNQATIRGERRGPLVDPWAGEVGT